MGIFGKPPDEKPHEGQPPPPRPAPPSAPVAAPAAPGAARSTTCVIGAKTVIKGEISGEEDVLVEGTFEGLIRIGRDLRVAPGGQVKANVTAQNVIVSGEVTGDCEASNRIEIHATGRLVGDIRAPKIVIAEGANFRGTSDMSGRREDRKERAAGS
jgi:cytoskeletal protein CcmA (bactofilin family)